MATLTGKQLKDSYQGLLTIKTADDANPLSGRLENGKGNAITNLGIGTDSGLVYPLTIKEDTNNSYIHFVNSTTGSLFSDGTQIGVPSGQSDFLINNRESANIRLFTSGDEKMRIDSSGNVGIGTSPAFTNGSGLEVERAGIATLRLQNTSTAKATEIIQDTNFEIDTLNSGMDIILDATTDTIFEIANSEIARINSTGLGIGVSPDTNLHIYDASGGATLKIASNTANAYDSSKIQMIGGNLSTSELIFGDTVDSDIGRIIYRHDGNSLAFDVNAGEKMRIDSSGNVGINRTNTGGKLDVNLGTTGTIGVFRGDTSDSFNIKSEDNLIALDIRNTSNGLTFQIQGSEKMRMDTSGNLGIGTDSPDSILEIAGTTPTLTIDDTRTGSWVSGDKLGTVSFRTSDGSGAGAREIGFIHIENEQAGTNTTMSGAMVFGSSAYNASAIERMRIDSSGNILFGGISALPNGTSVFGSAFRTDTNGRMGLRLATSATGAQTLAEFFNGNGSVGSIQTNALATSYVTSSDYRLKENVVAMTGALDRVDQLKPSRFNFIADADTTVDGFLAHEVADVVPEAISGEKDATEEYEVTPAVLDDEGNIIEEAVMGTRPVYQGIDQSKLVPLLVGAIQELRAEIEQLKNQ